jgi:4-hydroxy-tetrahydrodipicolinate synthase
MVTPFDSDLAVDYKAAAALADRLVGTGSDALVITGTTGEASTLTMDESSRLYETVMEAVGDRAAVIAGSGSNSTAEAVHLTEAARKAGVHATLQVAPYYNKPSQEGFFRHFKAIAESTDLPIILYNIPGRTAKNVEAETIIKLAAIDNIVGVKEASGDLEQVSLIIGETPDDFLLYSGDDFLTLPLLSLGADGVISVASHLAGDKIQQMVAAYAAGETARAASIHRLLEPLFKVLFITANPVPLKAALNMAGIHVGGVRLPLVEATGMEREKIREVLRGLELV